MQLFFDFCGTPDIVQYVHHGFGGGFDNIGGQADAVEAATVVVGDNIHLTQRIFTVTFGGQAVFHQFDVIVSDAVYRLVDGINRAVAVSGFCFNFFATGQFDGGSGNIVRT